MTNVETSKVFFGVVLKQLQDAFPAAYFISEADFWPDFERLASHGEISLRHNRSFKLYSVSEVSADPRMRNSYCRQMLRWMVVEGYIHPDPTSGFKYDYVLSSKSLSVLNLGMEQENETLGSKLKRLVTSAGEKASGEIISDLIDQVFATAQGFST